MKPCVPLESWPDEEHAEPAYFAVFRGKPDIGAMLNLEDYVIPPI